MYRPEIFNEGLLDGRAGGGEEREEGERGREEGEREGEKEGGGRAGRIHTRLLSRPRPPVLSAAWPADTRWRSVAAH